VLEERIGEWRSHLLRRQAVSPADVDELEDHLRTQVAELVSGGLDEEEAFLIGVKRIGNLDAVSQEYAREYSERLWKRLVMPPEPVGAGMGLDREARMALGFAVAAGVAIKAPALFGVHLDGPESSQLFYAHNGSLLILPFLAGFFVWKRGIEPARWIWVAALFALGALLINAMPFLPGSNTEILAIIHLPMALWLAMGVAYAGGLWRDHHQRMNFVRFSGEWFIYFVLIALGGGVLMGFTAFVFQAIGLDPETLIQIWILPCGVAGAVVVAGWLVESKQSVIENMAPVLTFLFTPLFTLLLLGFLGTMLVTGSAINIEREVLIGFDLLLVLVVGLVLYSISARDPQAEPRLADRLQLLLVVSALLVDALALWAILARITEFGFTPNRVAALGENLILLANLSGAAILYVRFLRRRAGLIEMERWQTAFLPVYAVWAWVVVALFPLVFQFR
jgi:hypothetical protein